ncbi:hypothetical protein [Actinokineospora sp. NPDC004072]
MRPDDHPTPADAGTTARHAEGAATNGRAVNGQASAERSAEATRHVPAAGRRAAAAERRDGAGSAVTDAIPAQRDGLFSRQEADSYRERWQRVQGGFVDDPAEAVEEADKLVVDAIRALSERKRSLESWREGAETEDLRQALREYRSFLDRLLTV